MIDIKTLSKSFGGDDVLSDLTFDIKQGEFFSLLGPSGCGKTTLLRTIAGFEEPTHGSISIDGADMSRVGAHRRPVNMVFQNYAIFPHLDVKQNVAFGLRRSGLTRAQQSAAVEEALQMVGLLAMADRDTRSLSGGQKQRVALARALILKPKVLLLDEPLAALDKNLREQMQGELRRLQRQVGITFVLVTHDQEEALILSDRVGVMFDGQVAQIADPQTLYRAPASRRVAEFIGAMNFFAAELVPRGGGLAIDVAGFGAAPVEADQLCDGVNPGPVSVGIRPETLALMFEGDPVDPSEIPATVRERAYYGDMTYYVVDIQGIEVPITISMKNVSGRHIFEQGETTRVRWNWGALRVFAP